MTLPVGPLFILAFSLSQAIRDVWFGHIFQGRDFFTVVVCAFLPASVIFAICALLRAPGEMQRIWRHGPTLAAMNITTALAWSCYFGGLKFVEPSVVNTIHSAMGPLTALALAAAGSGLVKRQPHNVFEKLTFAGMAGSIALLWFLVLDGRAGVTIDLIHSVFGLSLLFVSGASITISLLYSKRLHEAGFGSVSITAVRYLATVALAAVVVSRMDTTSPMALSDVAQISASGFLFVVLPTFILQMGIARTGALTGQIIRATGPAFVFGLEQFDGRISYAPAVFVAVLIYSAFAIASNFAHGWQPGPKTR